MKPHLTIAISLIVIVVALVVMWQVRVGYTPKYVSEPVAANKPFTQEQFDVLLEKDTTNAINEALNNLDVGEFDSEFEVIDGELNQL